MIEDPELRELFKAESEEHLERLDEGLLTLEERANDPAILKELFREAHSLKGAARMLGVTTVETVAHCFEDLLGSASRREIEITEESMHRMVQGLKAMSRLVREAVTGEDSGVKVSEVLALIKGEETPPGEGPEANRPSVSSANPPIHPPTNMVFADTLSRPPTPSLPVAQKSPPVAPKPPPVAPAPVSPPTPPPPPVQSASKPQVKSEPIAAADPLPADEEGSRKPAEFEKFRSDTIRIDPRKLDHLMAHAGELVVSKNRIRRRLTEIEEMIALLEECRPSTEKACLEQLLPRLQHLRQATFEEDANLELSARELEEGIRNLRLLPLSTLFSLFPRMVKETSQQEEKRAILVSEGGDVTADKRIIEELKDPLMHLIRNAIHHGLEYPETRITKGKPPEGTLRLLARRTATSIVVELEDDGRGLDLEAIATIARKRGFLPEGFEGPLTLEDAQELIFTPGFSTTTMVTDISGRGVGLDVVRANVEHHLKGTVEIRSEPDKGCRFILRLPLSLTTTRVFLVSSRNRKFALPVDSVAMVRRISHTQSFRMEGGETILINGEPVSVATLADLLDLPRAPGGDTPVEDSQHCVVLEVGNQKLGVLVDELLDELEVVQKSHGTLLQRVRNISGSTILGNGEVCTVLHPPDILKTVQKRGSATHISQHDPHALAARSKVILLAEDSITTRTQEKRILEAAGYTVITAVDGLDAFRKLSSSHFDALVSDIQMPNMDGLTLTEKVRQHRSMKDMPVILVTSLSSDEDRKRGLEVGADAYISKPTFDQSVFLDTLRRLT